MPAEAAPAETWEYSPKVIGPRHPLTSIFGSRWRAERSNSELGQADEDKRCADEPEPISFDWYSFRNPRWLARPCHSAPQTPSFARRFDALRLAGHSGGRWLFDAGRSFSLCDLTHSLFCRALRTSASPSTERYVRTALFLRMAPLRPLCAAQPVGRPMAQT